MARALSFTIGLSFAAHAAVAALLVRPTHDRVASMPTHSDPAPLVAGDTFELPAPETTTTPTGTESVPVTTTEAPASLDAVERPETTKPDVDGVGRPRASSAPGRHAAKPVTPSSTTESQATASGASGALYGAVGDRSATDLAATFARCFTQTASEDPAWQRAPLGSAGEAVVTLTIDDAGHITDVQIGGSPSAALRSSIGRTMALVKARVFTAHGRSTSIRLAATIATGSGGDGLEEGRYGISVHDGNASFVLPIGRRIELRVK